MKEYERENVGVRFIEPSNKLPKRKEIRLKDYDCTQDGYYFVTICTDRQRPDISRHKDVVKQVLCSLPERFSGLNIDWYVLMPTHIHVIFVFEGMQSDLSEVVRAFKALVTHEVKEKFWQRNYYEHIIRNEKALHNIREYIDKNPLIEKIKFEKFYERGKPNLHNYLKI